MVAKAHPEQMFFALPSGAAVPRGPPILPGAWCPPASLVRLPIPTERLAERPWRIDRQFLRVLEGKFCVDALGLADFAPSPGSSEVSLARAR